MLLALFLSAVLGGPALGEAPAARERADPCEAAAAAGAAALRAGRVDDALRAFAEAVREAPACAAPGGGLAGDGLGRALLASGDTARALVAWETTLGALTEETWARGGDALVGEYLMALVASGRGAEGRAALAFDLLLRPTTTPPPPPDAYWVLLAQVATVLPDDVRRRAFRDGDPQRGVTPEGSAALATWWLAQDPFPATAVNERIGEHLLRVEVALADYPDPARPTRYDDRGALYVRFGAPAVARRLAFDDPDLVFGMSRATVGVSRSSFPPNEVWTYAAPGSPLTYVLIGQDGAYRIGQTEDLLPSVLRTVTGQGRRQREVAAVALLAMRYIYGELATTALEYGNAWAEADAAVNQTASPFGNPASAAGRIQRQLAQREGEAARSRDLRAPASVSRVLQQTPPVQYVADVARFLTPNGRTRLDLVWALDGAPDGAGPLELVGTVVVDAGTARQSLVAGDQQILPGGSGDAPVRVSAASFECAASPCVPLLQLDLFGLGGEGARERVAASIWAVPPQELLRPTGMEISDLRPLESARNEPFAQRAVAAGTPLSLYFEVYGFEGETGRARVHIEYEVVRRRRGSLLRQTREVPSSGDLRLFVRGSRTEQFLILDTSDWAGSDEVDVRIVVRDEQTGETVERARTFAVE